MVATLTGNIAPLVGFSPLFAFALVDFATILPNMKNLARTDMTLSYRLEYQMEIYLTHLT